MALKRQRWLSWVLGLALVVGSSAPVMGSRGRSEFTVGRWTNRGLIAVHGLLEKEEYVAALKRGEEILERPRLSSHERALVWQTLGFVYSSLERLDDAAQSFESCLKLEALPPPTQSATRYNLGQVYMAREKYPEALKTLEAWRAEVETPTGAALYQLAGAYYHTGAYGGARGTLREAIGGVASPPESWLTLALSVGFELKDLKGAARTLKRLISLYPKGTYWLQLASVFEEQGDRPRALAALGLAYEAGYVTEKNELLHLTRLYVAEGVPFVGARILERAFLEERFAPEVLTLQFLGSAWIGAREFGRAVAPFREAASKSQRGEDFVRLANLQVELEDWEGTVVSLDEALQKGDLKRPGQVQLLKGITLLTLKNRSGARAAFREASKYERVRGSARQWLKHLEERS